MLHLAMHTAIVIVLAVTVTVVNNTRVTAVGVTMVVKKWRNIGVSSMGK